VNIDDIKLKFGEYPVATGAALVALVSASVAYFHWDAEDALLAVREERSGVLREITLNENNSRNLLRDIDRAKALHNKVFSKALDFESTISAQAFFADFVQRAPVKSEGLPVQDSLPTLMPDALPLAACSYKVHVTADFASLLKFLHSFGNHPERAMLVNRIQVSDADLDKKSGGNLSADVAFRLWGRKGELIPIKFDSDKKVLPAASRSARLASIDKLTGSAPIDLTLAINPFGITTSPTTNPGESSVNLGLESALNRLKFTIGPFLGVDAVKVSGSSPKRINNELEVNVDGRIERVKIIAINKDSFTVMTASGGKIKISLKQ
jgi:hypothetical protein